MMCKVKTYEVLWVILSGPTINLDIAETATNNKKRPTEKSTILE